MQSTSTLHGSPLNQEKAVATSNAKHQDNYDFLGKTEDQPVRIGVHCVAGLGRAPFLVAIAMVHNGCKPMNAIEIIRKNRPGSLNLIQATFLMDYKKAVSKKNKNEKNKAVAGCQCTIF